MDKPPSDNATPFVAAVTLGAAAFVGLSHCPIDPYVPPAVSTGTSAPSPAATGTAGADDRISFAPSTPESLAEEAGFELSGSGRRLATWTGCACPSGDNPLPASCRVAVWDVAKRNVVSSFAAPCVPWRGNVIFSPSDDRVYISSLGLLGAYRVTDGELLYQFGGMDCTGHTELSEDGQKLYRISNCGALELYRAEDGALLGSVETLTYNEVGDTGNTWDEQDDIIALAFDGRAITLAPLRGGPPRRVALPWTSEVQPPYMSWIPGTSTLLMSRFDGLLASLNAVSGTLRVLSGPSPARPNKFDLSESRDKLVHIGPSKRLLLRDLRTGASRDLGPVAGDAEPLSGIYLHAAPDMRAVGIVSLGGGTDQDDTAAVRLFRTPVPSMPERRAVAPIRPIDVAPREIPRDAGVVGWAWDGSLILNTPEALLALDDSGAMRVVKRFTADLREIRLTRNRRAVLVLGNDLTWVSLVDGRTATFVLARSGDELTGHIEGVDSDADWAAMGG